MPFSRTAAHIFVSPGDAPATITQYVAWMERQFNACQTPRSRPMYLSMFNSFRVIRCLSQCVSPKIVIFLPHFCFPWKRPCQTTAFCRHSNTRCQSDAQQFWRQDLCHRRTTSLQQSAAQSQTMWAAIHPVQAVTEATFIRTVRPRTAQDCFNCTE